MKKSIILAALTMVLALAMAGCNNKDEAKNSAITGSGTQATESAQTQNTDGAQTTKAPVAEGTDVITGSSENVDMKKVEGKELASETEKSEYATKLGYYEVSIDDAKVIETNGKNVLIVSYKFTNNTANNASFNGVLRANVYQDGMELPTTLVDEDIEGLELNSIMDEISNGKTIEVQKAFLLSDTTTPVECQVTEFETSTDNNEMASKIFNIE